MSINTRWAFKRKRDILSRENIACVAANSSRISGRDRTSEQKKRASEGARPSAPYLLLSFPVSFPSRKFLKTPATQASENSRDVISVYELVSRRNSTNPAIWMVPGETKFSPPDSQSRQDPSSRSIDHFTVVCSLIWPLNGSEAGGDLVLIQISRLLLCKWSCSYAN